MKVTEFNVEEYLDNDKIRNYYLQEVVKENDSHEFLKALEVIAKSKGMTKVAKESGVTREGLYKVFSANGNPAFSTVCKILNAIGYTISISPILSKHSSAL